MARDHDGRRGILTEMLARRTSGLGRWTSRVLSRRAALLATVLLAMTAAVTACGGGRMNYAKLIAYPSSAEPAWGDWEYRIRVDVYWDGGSYDQRCDKDVRIRIEDRDLRCLYEEEYRFSSVAAIKATADWEDFSSPTVELRESVDLDLDDEDARLIKRLSYRYDPNRRVFRPAVSPP